MRTQPPAVHAGSAGQRMSDPLSRYQLLASRPARRSVGVQVCPALNSERGPPAQAPNGCAGQTEFAEDLSLATAQIDEVPRDRVGLCRSLVVELPARPQGLPRCLGAQRIPPVGEQEAGGTELKEPAMCASARSMDAMNALSDELRMAHVREALAFGELEATDGELEATNARLAITEKEFAAWSTEACLREAHATAATFANSLRDADAFFAKAHDVLFEGARSSAALATQLSQSQAELAHARSELASTRAELTSTLTKLAGTRARLEEAESAEPVRVTQHLLSATMDLAAQQIHNKEISDRYNAVLEARRQAADALAQRHVARLIGDGESNACCSEVTAFVHLNDWR